MRLYWTLLLFFLVACVPVENTVHKTIKVTKNIDCEGGVFNKGVITELHIVASDVTIRRCTLNGAIRIVGLGLNGESKAVKESSFKAGHTERAQAASPTNVILYGLTINGQGRIPVYIGPGVTKATLVDSRITGKSDSVALYLDAESGYNIIRNNTFNVDGKFTLRQFRIREVIAVDGSAHNQIIGNVIKNADNGGIYLYRNCGEGGTVRHQAPQFNFIAGNTIDVTNIGPLNYGIWLGSRGGNRLYCNEDKGYPFGSSKDNNDFADYNTVKNNVFIGLSNQIKDSGSNNTMN